jgi:hypothetical protein
MGREASCRCRVGGKTYSVNALLESSVLILRGELKRSIALPEMTEPRVIGSKLEFNAQGEVFSLELGKEEASRWLSSLTRPLATLADKLGLKGDAKVYVIGPLADEALHDAVAGRQIDAADEATVCLAMTVTTEQLDAAVERHLAQSVAPLWIAHPKGKKSGLSEAVVRQTMRSNGYMDTKVSAVSEHLTATRYNLKS